MMEDGRGEWKDGWWRSPDGLSLHYRDYPGNPARVPVLCIPGLTRNARDFGSLAPALAGKRRVIVAELRGRGMSAPAPDPASYAPPTYLADIRALVEELEVGPVALIGTSLGGLIAMLLAATARPLLAGVLLNDIGPEIEEAGLARIRAYVGTGGPWTSWEEAAAGVAAINHAAFPDYGEADWLAMARRQASETPDGRIVPDYDPRIAEAFRAPPPPAGPVDLWPAFEALGGLPVTVARGALSDILSAATAAAMAERLPGIDLVTVPRVGHAPGLDEPEARTAIDRLLARVDGRARG